MKQFLLVTYICERFKDFRTILDQELSFSLHINQLTHPYLLLSALPVVGHFLLFVLWRCSYPHPCFCNQPIGPLLIEFGGLAPSSNCQPWLGSLLCSASYYAHLKICFCVEWIFCPYHRGRKFISHRPAKSRCRMSQKLGWGFAKCKEQLVN